MKKLPTIECSMLAAFEDTALGNLNTIERDGTLYVPAIETAMILGYRNPWDAIRRHCVCDTITVDEWVITGKKRTAVMPYSACIKNISMRVISIG